MPKKIDRKAIFKKGEKVPLDDVMDILPLIPLEYYRQDDPSEHDAFTYTEVIEFLADIEFKATVFLGDLTK